MHLKHCLLLLLICTTQIAYAQTEEKRAQQLRAWLKKYPQADADQDGVLTLEEARRYRDTVLKKEREKMYSGKSEEENVIFPRAAAEAVLLLLGATTRKGEQI